MIDLDTVYWIKISATLAVFVALIILFLRNSSSRSNIPGADLLKKELDRLGDSYTTFDDVIVQSDRGMLHISHVVVSLYGIFVITLCERRGKISGHRGDQEWILKSEGIKDAIVNPLWENRKHVNALEKKIGSQSFIPLVVFTHAKLVDDFGPIAVRVDQLQFFFQGHTKRLIEQDSLESVVRILNESV